MSGTMPTSSVSVPRRRQNGFSLLEVLVAMLILGVAVMGFAGLQVRALQSTSGAHVRSQAMTLASDLVERVRANPTALATYIADAQWGTGTIPDGEPSGWPATCYRTAISGAYCTDVQMATFDAQEVQFMARQLLPDGRVSVRSCDAAAGSIRTCVFVSWAGVDATDPAQCSSGADNNCIAMQVMVR